MTDTEIDAPTQAPRPAPPTGLSCLDAVDLCATLRIRTPTFQSVPRRLLPTYKHALRMALDAINSPTSNPVDTERGWKLFLLAPRLLLHRPTHQTLATPEELDRRAALFRTGEWLQLLHESSPAPRRTHPTPSPNSPTDSARAQRAMTLVQQGELSAASAALTASPLAPLTPATLAELRHPDRRPQQPQVPIDPYLRMGSPSDPLHLDTARLLANLRTGRRGAAPGPSGMTTEHLRVVLDSDETTLKLTAAATRLATAALPPNILLALRLGRMVALQKPNGRVRGLVMGDVFRRLVARTLAQQFSPQFQTATAPHQYALATRAGGEALARSVRVATELQPNLTVLSVDGVGAYDHIARQAILQGIHGDPGLRPLLPFVRQFYASPSEYLWYDAAGTCHPIHQHEGGEQGDPLMPGLYAVAVAPALQETHRALLPGEALLAYLDDTYILCAPERTRVLYEHLEQALRRHANVTLHQGKTRMWNASGASPTAWPPAPPDAPPLWVGGPDTPPAEQGVTVLGTPIGSHEYILAHLRATRAKHDALLTAIPTLPSLQASFLLLLYCANPRPNYLLRTVPPEQTLEYAAAHDAAMARCLATLLDRPDGLPATNHARARLSLAHGGLGLRSATHHRHAAYWASWADTLPAVHARWPAVADQLGQLLTGESRARPPSVQAAVSAAAELQRAGFTPPPWGLLITGSPPPPTPPNPSRGDPLRGWQRASGAAIDQEDFAALFTTLPDPERALLLSQAGPHAATTFTTIPTCPEFHFDNPHYRTLLLRRLRLPLGFAPARCRCGRPLDAFGDHRAACATSGALRTRAVPIERTLARILREAGARVHMHVPLAHMNLDPPPADGRAIEILAQGLPLWHGAQLAVDATLVSPVGRDGAAHPHAATTPATAITQATRRKRISVYPEFASQRRCRLVVVGLEIGGRWGIEAQSLVHSLAAAKARATPLASKRPRLALTHAAGQLF